MPEGIVFNQIPIFAFVDHTTEKLLQPIFHLRAFGRGVHLTSYDAEVPGLFILKEGRVDVLTPDRSACLAVLGPGSSFGEMSLLESGYRASASIVVASEGAAALFCEKEVFRATLATHPRLAHAFYKGSAILLAERLRNANRMISDEINRGCRVVAQALKESEVDAKLDRTRSVLDKTGSNLVARLIDVMPLLDQTMIDHPGTRADLQAVHDRIESVLYAEGQSFDRLSQQLDQILQHFDNMRRMVVGESPEEVTGDTAIFRAKPSEG